MSEIGGVLAAIRYLLLRTSLKPAYTRRSQC